MKSKATLFFCIVIIASFLLSSCSNVLAAATSTSTPTTTFTPASTNTPTTTPSPTETPDPNKPVGATGFDASSGYYTKEVNGTTLYWAPIQMTTADIENGITGHWFESRIAEGPINLTEGKLQSSQTEFTLNLNVYFIEGYEQLKEQGYLIHPKCGSDDVTAGYDFFPNTVIYDLFLRYYDRNRTTNREFYNSLKDPKDPNGH